MNGLLFIPIKLLASRRQESPLKFRVHIWTPPSINLGQSLNMVGVTLFLEKTCEVKWSESRSVVSDSLRTWTTHNMTNTPLGVEKHAKTPGNADCWDFWK